MLTNVAVLFGAEVNAEIERAKEIAEGIPEAETLALSPAERGRYRTYGIRAWFS